MEVKYPPRLTLDDTTESDWDWASEDSQEVKLADSITVVYTPVRIFYSMNCDSRRGCMNTGLAGTVAMIRHILLCPHYM